ncbi:MAG TPA: histidine kinase [Propionibacteriaceae bacterium]|nr:histidine kinase [Propionibacteriaceae bacterium]
MGIAWERDRVVRVVETVAVLALCALTVGGNLASVEGLWRRVLGVALGAAMTVPLLARRRAPLAVMTAVAAAIWLQFALLGPSVGALGSWVAYLVATYSVGAHPATRRAVVGLVVSTVPAAALAVVRLQAGADASEMVQPVVVLIAAWVAGRISARRHQRAELVEHRAAQVESGAADIAREAAERERTRIARELHDVVTHNMSVMVVQAQAAQTLAGSDTGRAVEAMRAVEDAGRTGLVEMRRLLGVIRADEPAGSQGDRAPQPRLDDLPGLVQRVREAGLPVSYAIDGDAAGVSAGVAVCAYRIVQEALSNVVRHCGAVPTRVHLRVSDSSLDLAVENAAPQRALPQAPTGEGRGLAGMRERVAVFDGKLETRSLPDGGFAVHATLPLGHR